VFSELYWSNYYLVIRYRVMKMKLNRMVVDMGMREKVSCWKYNKIRIVVDIEDEFRVWEAQMIKKCCTIK
jgi:hypothetical protein